MIKLLDSPSFKQLLNLQQAIRQLKEHIGATPPGKQAEFDFSPEGELVLPHEVCFAGLEMRYYCTGMLLKVTFYDINVILEIGIELEEG